MSATAPALLLPGDPAPWFRAPAIGGNASYVFDTVAGRPVLLLFLGSARAPWAEAALATVRRHRDQFDDRSACFFGITNDADDGPSGRLVQDLPGIRWLVDPDGDVAEQYRARGDGQVRAHWLLLDRALRVAGRYAVDEGERAVADLAALLAEPEVAAPVLTVPRVFEPAMCARLITLFEETGGEESGFMRQVDGRTVLRMDPGHKRRRDVTIEDDALIQQLRARLRRFLLPAIARAYQFQATRIERWMIACYSDEDAGHFAAHRDNTTSGTAHRKFACTINLNAEDYEGGDLSFPEFGQARVRAPTGGAVIFSCSLLHQVDPVVRGRRYAFLPFFYDEAGAKLREANMGSVDLGAAAAG